MKFACLAGLLIAPVGFAASFELRVISTRPDMVTGGDALLEADTAPSEIRLNGQAVMVPFRQSGTKWTGKIDGLRPGRNRITAKAGKQKARLEIINHPATGPVFSGPHQKPFVCQTEAAGLGPALDENCSAKTQITWWYKPSGGSAFRPLDPDKPRPSEIESTTTSDGKSVPFIVRKEMGTINRAIYGIAILHDPAQPAPSWNGRLIYNFGGGCRAGYRQGPLTFNLNAGLLARGYAHAASSLNVLGNNCNDVLSAETLMMVKEHFIERFGAPRFTIGSGSSGGSIQQHLIAQNYPGLLDGITPTSSYPDVVSVAPGVADCALLDRAFNSSKLSWTDEQKTAVSGYPTWATCARWMKAGYSPGWLRASYCDDSTPKGTRCGLTDNMANLFGAGRMIFDNTGVQYGLAALQSGKISREQFAELNRIIGGFDRDGNLVSTRSVADLDALRHAYRGGRINTGGGDLARIPMIDGRPYVDPTGDIHDSFRTGTTAERIGAGAQRVVFTNPPRELGLQILIDQWLTNGSKPAELVSACWTQGGEKITDPARCAQMFPPAADPRIAAGAPSRNDILKCALRPAPEDLRGVFPAGVCDYSKPGIGKEPFAGPWRRY